MKKTFKYRLYPNKTQIKCIDEQFYEARNLYNCALEHRITVYKKTGKSVSYYDQANELKLIRADGFCKLANFSASQDILHRIDKAYKAFFARIKRGEKAGFPRFKGKNWFHSITFPSYGDGCKLKGNKVYFQGMGDIHIRLHRPIDGVIKTVTIVAKNDKYYVCFSCEVDISPLPKTDKEIGIDMGLESFLITSNNEFVANPRFFKNSQRKLRVLQRSVSRKKKGGSNRKKAVKLLAKQHEKIANQRLDFLRKEAAQLVKENDIICIEDLNIKGLAGGMLAKSVHDVAWGIFFDILIYKAESADKKVIEVNPNGTSQRCSQCGTTVKKDLSVRWHHCPVCGFSVHRDYNSALGILRLGTNRCPSTCGSSQCVGQEAD